MSDHPHRIRALILQKEDPTPPGHAAEWLASVDAEAETFRIDLEDRDVDPTEYDLVVSLGSEFAAFDDTKPFGKETRKVVVNAQFAGNQPGTRLECGLATLRGDEVSKVGDIKVTSKKSCQATFEKVPLGDVKISVTGTWHPVTPVGGCKKLTITDSTGVVTMNLTAAGFGGCLLQ